ncbi:hypothetical protein HDV05_006059, partial [Chytridiales sp. JEL 0842]
MNIHWMALIALIISICVAPSVALPQAPTATSSSSSTATSTTLGPSSTSLQQTTTNGTTTGLTTTTTTLTATTTTTTATTTTAAQPTATVNQALVITKVGAERGATFTLDAYEIPYVADFTLEVTPGTGNYSMIIMTSNIYGDVNGSWESLLSANQTATIHEYLARYNVKLVRLNDAPDASTGVSPIGFGTGLDQPFVIDTAYQPLATSVGIRANSTFSTAGLYHFPGQITNASIAKPVAYFRALAPDFPQDTIAAAEMNITVPGVGSFMQMSLYLPFEEYVATSINLGRFWLKWITNNAIPPNIGPLSSFRVHQRVLVISGPADDSGAATNILRAYGMPHDLYIVGSGDFALEVSANASIGAYSVIVLTTSQNSLTAPQQRRLTSYLISYSVNIVKLNDFPDAGTGVVPYNGQGTGDNQPVYLTPEGAQIAQAAGVQPSILLPTTNLWRIPARISDPTLATPILMFQPAAGFPEPTVAAALISFPFYQQLSFYVPAGSWSLTSVMLGHIWFTWGTRGFYPGYRRIAFSTQVSDIFLPSYTQSGSQFRLSGADMVDVQRWQTDLNSRMNSGSRFRLELGFNGNGVYAETNKRFPRVRPVYLPSGAYQGVDQNFKKPLGTGVDAWASVNLSPYSSANVAANLNNFLSGDSLFNHVYNNQDQYFLASHTFTHQDLNNCTYQDALNEITVNANFASGVGFTFSQTSMITPSTSGILNGDALRAMTDAGVSSTVGDVYRPNINNPNPHWPFTTSISSSNFAGFTVLPRVGTQIYADTSTPAEVETVYARWATPSSFSSIMETDVQNVLFKLMNLHWDPYHFYQSNLRSADLPPSLNPPPAARGPMSTYNSGIALSGSRNGATSAYTSGNLSVLGGWAERLVQSFNQLVSWPMVTYSLDSLSAMYIQRVERDNAGVDVQVEMNEEGFMQFRVSSQGPCVAPVTFPAGVLPGNL